MIVLEYEKVRKHMRGYGLLNMLVKELEWERTLFKYAHGIAEHKRALRRMKKLAK